MNSATLGRSGDTHEFLLRSCVHSTGRRAQFPTNLFNMTTKRLLMKGLIVGDWLDHQSEFEREVGGYFRAGKLKNKETVVEGIDQAVDAFLGLFSGRQLGKAGGEADVKQPA
jgi:NADPH-dependent curcumin reductase CurA